VAKSALRLAEEGLVKPLIDIPAMAAHLKKMVDLSLGAFLDRDTQAAREVCRMDDYMDDLDHQIFRELLLLMMGDSRMIRPATELIAVSRTLERAGDHATNLGERIIYMVSGKVERASQHRRPKSEKPGAGDLE
jgi:phosphate transport system protein